MAKECMKPRCKRKATQEICGYHFCKKHKQNPDTFDPEVEEEVFIEKLRRG